MICRCGDLLRFCVLFFFQAEDGIRDLVRSRGLGDVYKRQRLPSLMSVSIRSVALKKRFWGMYGSISCLRRYMPCLLYTSDAADERSSVDLGGRRIIKKKTRGGHAWRLVR